MKIIIIHFINLNSIIIHINFTKLYSFFILSINSFIQSQINYQLLSNQIIKSIIIFQQQLNYRYTNR